MWIQIADQLPTIELHEFWNTFTFQAGGLYLIGKLAIKIFVRSVHGAPVAAPLADAAAFFGVDLAAMGISLLVSALASSSLALGGEKGAFDLLKILAWAIVAILAYLWFHRPTTSRFSAAVSTAVGWLSGMYPFSIAMSWLKGL